MTWGLMSSGNAYGSHLRTSSRQDLGLLLGGGGSGGGSSSSKTPASNAAVSALTLLSFLFFLNLLQQQLSAGQQQTLLFMVNNTGNATRLNRRRRPLIAVASVQAKQGFNGRTKLTIKAMRNGKIKKRKQRDVDLDEKQAAGKLEIDQNFDPPFTQDEKIGAGALNLIQDENLLEDETEPPIMMAGLPQASSLQLSAWLQGQLTADDLRDDLTDTLTSCRAVVACSVHKAAKKTDLSANKALPDDAIRKLLGEAGEYAEPGRLDEACDDLLLTAGEDCSLLAKAFANLLPEDKNQQISTLNQAEKSPQLKQSVKGDL